MTNKEQIVFVVFLVHALAVAWNKTPSAAYAIFKRAEVIENYILPCYDTLHTLGTNYLIEDITGYVEDRGVRI